MNNIEENLAELKKLRKEKKELIDWLLVTSCLGGPLIHIDEILTKLNSKDAEKAFYGN